MADQQSHNDKDLQLARLIKQARETGTPLEEIDSDEPLLASLLSYKQQKEDSFAIDESEKKEVWKGIAAETRSSSKTKITPLFGEKTIRWAAAAILLIAGLFSFIYLQFYQQPTLVAESRTSIKSVQLSDGSTVTLRPHSKLYALEQKRTAYQYKLEGEALFKVTEDPERTFSVTTGTGRVSVLGTSFVLSSWGKQMQVYLREGSIKVEALQQDSSIVLKPGQSATVTTKKSIPRLQPAKVKEFVDWLDKQMVFENRSAQLITGELEQHFNISITLPPDVAGKKLTGQLSLQNLQTAFQDLEIVLGGTFVKTGDRNYTFKTD